MTPARKGNNAGWFMVYKWKIRKAKTTDESGTPIEYLLSVENGIPKTCLESCRAQRFQTKKFAKALVSKLGLSGYHFVLQKD